jgi:CheY-like chemotaxis protein
MTSAPAAGQVNVLVIDDDPDVRDLLVAIVLRRDHQVIAVESAEEGLELLPTWTFQVAFIDQNLPGMDGVVLGEYLRRNNPHMVIALVTGETDRAIERRTLAMAIRFVPKPFHVAQILEILDDAVADADEREAHRRRRDDPDFAPPIAHYVEDLADAYEIHGVPQRIEERLVQTVKRALNDLRSGSRYTERARVTALCGLLAAKLLNLELPRGASGQTLFDEYDTSMRAQGRRTEFEVTRRASEAPAPPPRER